MAFCLIKDQVESFRKALADDELNPGKLAQMDSAERRALFESIVGEKDGFELNAQFESKLILKNQKLALQRWLKKNAGFDPKSKELKPAEEAKYKDLLTRIEKLDKVLDAPTKEAFLADLAEKKLGAAATFDQAQTITRLAGEARELLDAIPEDAKAGGKEETAYGLKLVELQNTVRSIKGDGEFHPIKDFKEAEKAIDKAKAAGNVVVEIAGSARGLLSAGDNSFFGRQGLPVLMTNPTVWAKAFVKSWGHLGRSFIESKSGVSEMDMVFAKAYGSKNARLGRYTKGKLAIGMEAEEAFPTTLPEKIPLIGRFFKASETAFQAGAVEMRVALMDKFIERAEEFGVDVDNKAELQNFGRLANSLTGRGGLGDTSPGTLRVVNAFLFSPRFLKANLDVLTAHGGGLGFDTSTAGGKLARRIAIENVAKIAAVTVGLLYIADKLHPGSVEWDPRSSKFGKIGIDGIYYDITGGKGSLLTVLSRANPVMPTRHGSEGGLYGGGWSYWSKSATTGNWTDLTAGKFGQQTGVQVWSQFFTGKFAPIPGVARDVLNGQNFNHQKPTVKNTAISLVEPLPAQSVQQTGKLESLIGELFGASASTYQKKK